MRDCPQPFPDCRPGACNCDGVYDRARLDGQNPEDAVRWWLCGLRDGQKLERELLGERLAALLTPDVDEDLEA